MHVVVCQPYRVSVPEGVVHAVAEGRGKDGVDQQSKTNGDTIIRDATGAGLDLRHLLSVP